MTTMKDKKKMRLKHFCLGLFSRTTNPLPKETKPLRKRLGVVSFPRSCRVSELVSTPKQFRSSGTGFPASSERGLHSSHFWRRHSGRFKAASCRRTNSKRSTGS